MRVMVIGGDGYCGWPTAHCVCQRLGTPTSSSWTIYSRRQHWRQSSVFESLVINFDLWTERVAAWAEIGGSGDFHPRFD